MLEKIFQPGDKVKIYPVHKKGEIYYLSQIEEIKGEEVLISAPIKLGRILPLSVGKGYTFDFYTDQAIYRANPEIVRRSREGNLFLLHVNINTEEMRKIQRRNYFRIDCLVPIKITDYIIEGPRKELISDLPEEAVIVNISGGGFKFLTKNQYEQGTTIKLQMELEIRDELVEVFVEGTVIDSEPLYDASKRYVNRVKISKISPRHREQIIRYVFEQQVKQKGK